MAETLTIKRGDKHDVKLTIVNSPLDLSGGGSVKVYVTPSTGGEAQEFTASLSGNTVTWALDGTLIVGRYRMEIEVTVSGFVITAPNNGYMELIVMQDLA